LNVFVIDSYASFSFLAVLMVIAVAVALVVDAAQRIRVLMGVHLLQELPLRYEFARVLESSPLLPCAA